MDVRAYIQIIIKNWLILLVAVVVTVAGTLVFTLRQPRIYESESTFVIRPHSGLILQDEFVRTLDTLSRRVEINNTFAEVANSKLIKDQAADQLGLSSNQRKGLSADGRVLAGTNILRLTVKGNDPEVAQAFAEAVSLETVNYISSLYDVFELGQLDGASLSRKPVSPDVMMNLALGGVVGIALGLMLIFLKEYLSAANGPQRSFDIIDPDTGVYNRTYLDMRLRQEASRAQRNGGHLSLALIRVSDRSSTDFKASAEAMPAVATVFEPLLRDEDLLACYDEATFALMLPDLQGGQAQTMVEKMRLRLGSAPVQPERFYRVAALRVAAGVAEMGGSMSDDESLLRSAAVVLREAERGTYGRVILYDSSIENELPQDQAADQPHATLAAANTGSGARANGALANGTNGHGANGDGASTKGTLGQEIPGQEAPSHEATGDSATPDQPARKAVWTRAAMKLAQQYNIDLDIVEGTGKDGRVLKSDVKAIIDAESELGLSTQ